MPCIQEFKCKNKKDLSTTPRALHCLWTACKRVKCTLDQPSKHVHLPFNCIHRPLNYPHLPCTHARVPISQSTLRFTNPSSTCALLPSYLWADP
ncbi:hypothetical protein K503DRAFT_767817 [Rhizopogon vinicolor AM-OR11-026]|uniref:Uncharacterized protein n=1 Tax=Rhizopogon vinicolor AM-OR11-026 TaxID=1314800 RepID=A0A1B7N8W3_9AGAM|nr:hypothetical protein K503DRAFT_767817 [Rhizopogon vinicolor AM-OR11-026]